MSKAATAADIKSFIEVLKAFKEKVIEADTIDLEFAKTVFKAVQKETRALLLAKWPQYFTEEDLMSYHQMIISRFANPKIIDEAVDAINYSAMILFKLKEKGIIYDHD